MSKAVDKRQHAPCRIGKNLVETKLIFATRTQVSCFTACTTRIQPAGVLKPCKINSFRRQPVAAEPTL